MYQDDSFSDNYIDDLQIKVSDKPLQVVLFSQPTCPMCQVLKQQLADHSIKFTLIDDMETISQHHIYSVPTLLVDDVYFNFPEALKWVRTYDYSR